MVRNHVSPQRKLGSSIFKFLDASQRKLGSRWHDIVTGFFCFLFLNTIVYAQEKKILPVEHWTTANGAQVYFVPTSTPPILDIRVNFDAGSSRDGTHAGQAYLANTLITESTQSHTADEVATTFDKIGALFDTSVERDMATISLRCLSSPVVIRAALPTFIDAIAHPAYTVQDFARKQKQQLSALHLQQQSPGDIADENFYAAVYGTHPYAHPILGTLESVAKLTPEDLKKFHQQYYVAKNVVIAIVGTLPKSMAEKIADQIARALPTGTAAPELPLATPLHTDFKKKISFDASQTHIEIGEVGITPNDPDYFPLVVGNHILGGGILVSRLNDEIREKHGLAYVAQSELVPLAHRGVFNISLQTRHDAAEEALQRSLKTLQTFIAQGPTEEELKAAKKNIIGSYPLRFSNNAGIVRIISLIGFYHRPLNYLDIYPNKINAVTSVQIRDAFKKHFPMTSEAIITVGKS